MDKEFESLETLSNEIRYKKEFIGNDTYRLYIKKNEIELLEKYLTELKQIKEAKPSEALKFINTLLNARLSDKHFINVANDETWLELSNIKLYILKAQELEKKNAEYKEALRIIKEKDVNIWYLTVSTKVKNYKDYNSFLMNDKSKRQLTEEEFDLVRRVLR